MEGKPQDGTSQILTALRFGSECHNQDVAMRRFRGNERRYRRYAVKHTWVVDKRRIKGMPKREVAKRLPIRCVNGSRTAGNVVPVDQQHEHEVDTVAMTSLGSGFAGRIDTGFDAKLVHLHMPMLDGRCQRSEEIVAKGEDGAQAGATRYWWLDSFEPSLDIALQGVVLQRLVVRLMWRQCDGTVCVGRKCCMTPPAKTSFCGEIGIGP